MHFQGLYFELFSCVILIDTLIFTLKIYVFDIVVLLTTPRHPEVMLFL